ncbi:hypothetical protein LCGC14_2300210 [marine sediment metagenome]|uniref:Thioredoxin domain-containing protein n=1 Tax=marine sediment metagenome TaxID=412755 RepID=A0A0F9DB78_9ZZZZ
MRTAVIVGVLVGLVASGGWAAEVVTGEADIVGAKTKIPYQRASKTILLPLKETAAAFGWEGKLVSPGKLAIVCTKDVCVPLRLDKLTHRAGEKGLLVDGEALGQALGFSIEAKGKSVLIRPGVQPAGGKGDVPAYNAAWGAKRGFGKGQTLPDIPLYDLQGREVRFSAFLGKRYIIYVWASWCGCRNGLPGWQKRFEKYKDKGFTVVGLALDVEGIAPAKIYYDRFGVKFHSLVDPNYATGFRVAPKTFFVDEHGVVQNLRGWEKKLESAGPPKPVTDKIRAQWATPGARLKPAAIAALVKKRLDEVA